MSNRQDPDLAASALTMRGRERTVWLAVSALGNLLTTLSQVVQGIGWDRLLATAIAEAELALAQLEVLVRQHSGTDETMDRARSTARARLVADVTHWRKTRRLE